MANENLGASFSIDITKLKAGLTQANRLIRESNSEFQAAAAGMDDWSSSEEGLTAKLKNLNTVADLQGKKVDALQKEYDRLISEGMDPASAAAVKMRTDINKEKEALAKTEKEIEKQQSALNELSNTSDNAADSMDDVAKSTKKAGDEAEKSSGKFEGFKKTCKVAIGAIGAIAIAVTGLIGGFLSLGESTKETQTAMAKLNQSFDTAGLGAEAANQTITDLYGVLGDMDRSTEAANLLAKMSKNEQDLEANSRILTGVFAEFGDSIPTEGLAEGMQATAEMGQVQGVLADALEWQGINLDEYNAKLESMASAEERAAYIQSTLTDLYGKSADAYRENNKALIESNEAQLRMEQTLADIGAVALPIMTELKNVASDLLETISPFVKLIGEGLTGALNGSADATTKLSEGLSGIVNALIQKVMDILPMIISVISQIIPSIIETLVSQLPAILGMLIQIWKEVINVLTEIVPTIVKTIVEIVPELIEQFIAAVPDLLQAAVILLTAIVDALPEIITKLIAALPSLIQTIIDALIKSIPILIQAAIQMFNAIIQAIPTIIQALTQSLPTIIEAIINGLIDAIPLVLDGAIQMLMAIVDAIPSIIDALIVQLPHIIRTITGTLLANLPTLINAAVKLWLGIVTAIPKMIPQLVAQLPQIITAIVNGLSSGITDMANVGKDLIRGLWNGINDMVGWIGQKIQGFGESVLGGLKSFFGINSPSRLMRDVVGKNIALGIGEGFEENIGPVNDEIQKALNFDSNVNVNASGKGGISTGKNVTVYQTNNYSQAHSRYELFKSKQQTEAAVRLALGGA